MQWLKEYEVDWEQTSIQLYELSQRLDVFIDMHTVQLVEKNEHQTPNYIFDQ